jgi:hypothetical protein
MRNNFLDKLKEINAQYSVSPSDLYPFRDSLMNNIKDQQELWINTRLELIQNINDDEWEKLEQSIQGQVADEGKKKEILASLETFKVGFSETVNRLTERNVIDTPILSKKSSSTEDLFSVAKEANHIRMETFKLMLDFRSDLRSIRPKKSGTRSLKNSTNCGNSYNYIWEKNNRYQLISIGHLGEFCKIYN